jgi:hypothetical protein
LQRKLKGGVANGSVEAVGNLNPESGRRNGPDQLTAAGFIKSAADPKIELGPATIM